MGPRRREKASKEIIEKRQAEAKDTAEKKGHILGSWHLGQDDRYHAHCMNTSCKGEALINPEPNGIATGISVFAVTCPYLGS